MVRPMALEMYFLCRVSDSSVLRGVLGPGDSSSKTAEREEDGGAERWLWETWTHCRSDEAETLFARMRNRLAEYVLLSVIDTGV